MNYMMWMFVKAFLQQSCISFQEALENALKTESSKTENNEISMSFLQPMWIKLPILIEMKITKYIKE